jgi:secondary thiamine-phosphate synthase enzyme
MIMESKKNNLVCEAVMLSFATTADTDVIDITRDVVEKVAGSGIAEGQALVFTPGSTAALTTIEYESGVVRDLIEAIERLVPKNMNYRHDARWGDGNGYAHVRSALLRPSLTVPVVNGRLVLGTWQQIVLIDFDNRPRKRQVVIQASGLKSRGTDAS